MLKLLMSYVFYDPRFRFFIQTYDPKLLDILSLSLINIRFFSLFF